MRKLLFQLGAFGFGLAPFAFGVMRAMSAARDLRMLWMAAASGLGAAVVLMLTRDSARGGSLVRQSAIILVVATVLAAGVAYVLGATAWFGVWAVAFVLAGCWTAATVCRALLRVATSARSR